MTDATVDVAANDAAQSQIIDTSNASPDTQGKGVYVPDAKEEGNEQSPKMSPDDKRRESIVKAFKDQDDKAKEQKAKAEEDLKAKDEPKEDAKADKDAKAEKVEEAKPAKADKAKDAEPAKADKGEPEKVAAERGESDERRQSEGRKIADPPARFLPEARGKWANVPNEVKAEFHRVSQEMESEISEHKQFREDLKEYEDLAKQHNTTVKGTLDKYVNADRMLNQDFGRGVSQLAQMYGHNPVQAIAAILQANGVTPQQYAQHIQDNPQAHQAPAPRQQQQAPQQPQSNEEIEALRQEIHSIRAEQQLNPMIQKFQSAHTDYAELEGAILKILQSGLLDNMYGAGLSPEQKLKEAYRMAGGTQAPSRSEPEPVQDHSSAQPQVPSDDAGTRSIKGSPSGGKTPQARTKSVSRREAVARAFANAR